MQDQTEKIQPRSRTIEVRGEIIDIQEMPSDGKARWARIHIEAALLRLQHRVLTERDVVPSLFEMQQAEESSLTLEAYLQRANAPKVDGLAEALRSLYEADDVLAALAVQHATGRSPEDVGRLVVRLTDTEKAALIAAQNDVNQIEQLAGSVDLRVLLAQRLASTPDRGA
jgi:hypothetical protein